MPDGRRVRYELSDQRLGHALDDLRAAVVATDAARISPAGEASGVLPGERGPQ